MDKEKRTTLTLLTKLITLCVACCKASNISEAIRKAIIGFFSNSMYRMRMDDFALHQILNIEERRETESVSIRMSEEMLCSIEHYKATTSFNTITVIIANFLFFSGKAAALTSPPERNLLPLPAKLPKDESMKLLRLMGSKWAKVMQYAIKRILTTSGNRWENSIDVFAGALGIFSNFHFASNEVINDIDLKKINLYKVIKKYPDTLLLKIHAKNVDQAIFEQCKNLVMDTTLEENSPPDVAAAVVFIYTNVLSVRHKGESFAETSYKTYAQKTDAIMPLHERLQNTTIYSRPALNVIKKYQKEEDTIFIVDPPYLDKDHYKDYIQTDPAYEDRKAFTFDDHVQLAEMLRTAHTQYGTDFIYFCRTTITRIKNRSTKKITNTDKLDSGDRHMQGRIDDFFWGYGFYYVDVPYSKDGTIERIITSFDFEGAKPYGEGVS